MKYNEHSKYDIYFFSPVPYWTEYNKNNKMNIENLIYTHLYHFSTGQNKIRQKELNILKKCNEYWKSDIH
jgi:hypothetical protein